MTDTDTRHDMNDASCTLGLTSNQLLTKMHRRTVIAFIGSCLECEDCEWSWSSDFPCWRQCANKTEMDCPYRCVPLNLSVLDEVIKKKLGLTNIS